MPDNADLSEQTKKQGLEVVPNLIGLDCHSNPSKEQENNFDCFLHQESPIFDFDHYDFSNNSQQLSISSKLPPLSTVFTQENKSLCSKKESLKTDFLALSDKRYSILNTDFSLFTDQNRINYLNSLERGNATEPLHVLVNHSEQTIALSSAAYHNAYDANATIPCDKNRAILRKRHHNRVQDNSLPPNVNEAFKKLRNLIPTEPADRRLSKVETLRLAVSYIQHLGQTLSAEHWVEQPCLINKVRITESQSSTSAICTFCMSKKRKFCINTR